MLPPKIDKYLRTRAASGPWRPVGATETGFSGAVVIPALAEQANLFATLRSLAANPPECLARFLVLVVVNNRTDAPAGDKADNQATLARLAGECRSLAPLRLGWVDASSPGLELPDDKGGVGMARKLGFDLALPLLDYRSGGPVLAALDADTLVRPDYLPALESHFGVARAGGAVIPFRHQPGGTPREEEAIRCYELYLRSYVLGLSVAGSPYAFHTVGSAMACSAGAYAAIGGMNTRVAAEDFYFLQQLRKTVGVAQVTGTEVQPSSRPSHRVPFGTGRSVSRLLAGEREAVLFYRPECFVILREWLSLVETGPDQPGDRLLERAGGISPSLAEYLDGIRFPRTWEKLRGNNRDRSSLIASFHGWFDGLRTMRLVHHLSAGPLPRAGAAETVPHLLAWAGLGPLTDPEAQLSLLRRTQSKLFDL